MFIAISTLLAIFSTIGFGWWWSWLKTVPKSVSTSNQHPQKRGWTFRVRGVPHDWDRDRLRSSLTEQGSASPAVQSLASEIHGRSQTATISFLNVPSQLRNLPAGRTWDIPLPVPSDQFGASRSLALDDGFLGITTLYAPPPPDHKVDIVAISGLGGHAFGSFKDRHGEHMWLRDALPYSVVGEVNNKPITRVMVYGYDSSLPQSNSFQNLEDLGTAFYSHLRRLAIAGTFQPIIFIAHSLGGLIVKQILISLSKSNDDEDQKLIRAVYGVAFFGVPHGGMDISSLISMVKNGPNRFLLESIGHFSSQILSIQQREFPEALGGQDESKVICFYETRMSPTAIQDKRGKWGMEGPAAVLVSKSSATHCRPWENGPQSICAIDRTHSEMVKFGPEDDEYEKVVGRIQSLIREALTARRSPLQPKLSPQEQSCLKSLAFKQMQNRAHDIERAVSGTCEWLLQHETFMSWASSNQGLLWIKGKPGSGKSTLLKYAFGNQQAVSSASNSDLVLFFFFHGRGDELQKTPLGFFRSLLHQVLKQAPKALSDLVDTFEQKCKEIGNLSESWQWHPEELWQFFELSLPKILATRSVWLFVDALDECGESNAKDLVRKFKSLLEMPTPPLTYSKQLRICFSCRHYPIVSSHDLFEICLEGENRADISTYVQSELSSFRELISPTISDLIIKRASGIFLWAQLVVRRVRDLGLQGEGEKKIMAAVRSIPEGLDELYNELIRGMGSTSLKLIQWICFATRPLSVDELRLAMAINADCQSLQACQLTDDYVPDVERMKRQILKLSRGLAETTPGSGTQIVQFIHQSVKDFFIDKGGLMSTGVAIGMAQFQLSRTCIRYLAMEEIGRLTNYIGGKMDADFPFLSYAAASWITHTKESDARDISQEDLLELFAWPSNDLLNLWVRIYNNTEEFPKDFHWGGGSLLHIAARYQILGALNAIIRCAGQTTVCFDSDDREGMTPLSWAAKEGHEAVVKLLFTTGQVDINSTDNLGQTPLSMAAQRGHEAVVKLFLATGQVEVNLGDEDSRTPLSWAAEKGHEAVIKLLLATGQAEVDLKDNFGRTPLSLAAEGGHEAVVKLLLATGQVDINSEDKDGYTPLLLAARKAHVAVVKLLRAAG